MTVLRISAPSLSARLSSELLASTLARLLASGTVSSKPELARASGLARSTVDAGVHKLLSQGVIRRSGYHQVGGRGRAAEVLELNPDYGYVLVADCSRHSATLGVFDFRQERLKSLSFDVEFMQGPEHVLDSIQSGFREILDGLPQRPLVAVVGVPAPVDHRAGTFVRPFFMPGWDRYPVAQQLSASLGCDVILENDVHLRALGEMRAGAALDGPLIYVKVGTGIGAGIVTSRGDLFRGSDGSAGEIGHIKVAGQSDPCVCGSSGCLETVASVGTLTRKMLKADPATPITRQGRDEFITRLRQGDPDVVASVREAAQFLGETIASLVHVVNPRRIVLGGLLAATGDELLATVRSTVYEQALPIATRELTVAGPALGSESGIAGGVVLGIEHALAPARLDRADG